MVGAVITHSAGTSPFRAVPKQDVDLPHGVLMNEVQLDERFDNLALAPELQWHCEPVKWSIRPDDRILRISPDANTDYYRLWLNEYQPILERWDQLMEFEDEWEAELVFG